MEGSAPQRPPNRLTVAQAADQLAISEDAVRSRIKRGTLGSIREEGTVYVLVGPPTKDRPTTGKPTDQPTEEPTARDDLIEELRDRVRALEEANRENRRIIAGLVQRIPELEAPPAAADEAQSAGEEPGGVEDPGESAEPEAATSQRRSWWRRLLGR